MDPLNDKYPFYSSYQYAGNKPVTFYDRDGLEEAANENTQVTIPEKPLQPLLPIDEEGSAYTVNKFDLIPQTHIVQQGDTYSALAEIYGVTVEQLQEWNEFEATEIPIGAELIVSNPNLRVRKVTAQTNETVDGERRISYFHSTQVFDQGELVASRIETRNLSIPLVEDKSGKMSASEQREALIYDSIALAGSIIAVAGGIALIASGAGAAAGVAVTAGAISTISGIIGTAASGGKMAAHIKNTPKSNEIASKVPTNLASTLTAPVDVARGDEEFTFSKRAGLGEDALFLFMRPKASGARKMKDLFDYSRPIKYKDFLRLPSATMLQKNIKD